MQFNRLPDEEAAKALSARTAKNLQNAEAYAKDVSNGAKQSCGAQDFKKSDYISHCRIAVKWPGDAEVYGCSATKIGDNRLATAAHCFLDPEKVGYPGKTTGLSSLLEADDRFQPYTPMGIWLPLTPCVLVLIPRVLAGARGRGKGVCAGSEHMTNVGGHRWRCTLL